MMTEQSGQEGSALSHFWSFEKLIGRGLIKALYFLGLLIIGLSILIAVIDATGGADGSSSIGRILGILLGGAIAVTFWRLACELGVLAFQTYDRLGEIRDRLPPPGPQP